MTSKSLQIKAGLQFVFVGIFFGDRIRGWRSLIPRGFWTFETSNTRLLRIRTFLSIYSCFFLHISSLRHGRWRPAPVSGYKCRILQPLRPHLLLRGDSAANGAPAELFGKVVFSRRSDGGNEDMKERASGDGFSLWKCERESSP